MFDKLFIKLAFDKSSFENKLPAFMYKKAKIIQIKIIFMLYVLPSHSATLSDVIFVESESVSIFLVEFLNGWFDDSLNEAPNEPLNEPLDELLNEPLDELLNEPLNGRFDFLELFYILCDYNNTKENSLRTN